MISNETNGRPFLLDSFIVATSEFSAVCVSHDDSQNTHRRKAVQHSQLPFRFAWEGTLCASTRHLDRALKLSEVSFKANFVAIATLNAEGLKDSIAIRARLHKA